jgi:hypothetical protein
MNNQGFSNATELKVLDHVFGGPDYVRPANLYVALLTEAIDDTDTGTTIAAKEASYEGYARLLVVNNATNFPAAADGVKTNGVALTFDQCTDGADTISHFAICDAPVDGHVITYGALGLPKPISAGDTPSIPIGGLTIGLD